MKKLNTTLLIITTTIAVFFFIKFVDSVIPKFVDSIIPKYKWNHIIYKKIVEECIDFKSAGESCHLPYFGQQTNEICDETLHEEPFIYNGRYGYGLQYNATSTYKYCYKKERTRRE